MRFSPILSIVLAFSLAGPFVLAKRPIQYGDISHEVREALGQHGIHETDLNNYVRTINQNTAEREREGEYDHLVNFVLQSMRFTKKPRVEPALSASEFVGNLSPEEKSRYLSDKRYLPPIDRFPLPASQRFRDFIKAVKDPTADERLFYLRDFIQKDREQSDSLAHRLYAQYARSMRFLYQKEFASRDISDPRSAAIFVSSLYQDRGHSTDTQIEANFAIYIALAALKSETPSLRVDNVLIVGPGLDFAPRTDLIDIINPQSYQPFMVADALLALKLSASEALRIHCVDINDRVIGYLRGFPRRRPRQMSIISGVADNERHPLSSEYKGYFRELGKSIGVVSSLDNLPEEFDHHLKKSLAISREVAESITADKLNIITERYDPSPQYDLVIVTNVFAYFNANELLLSLVNIQSMIRPGGYLIHNEARQRLFSFARSLGLPMVQSRTILIAAARQSPLYDSVWVHKK